jgi:hypothetical protein
MGSKSEENPWCRSGSRSNKRSTIRTQRLELRLLLRDSPSLHPRVPAFLVDIYPAARVDACDETGLPETAFPQECPWTAEQILDDDFWPEHALPI